MTKKKKECFWGVKALRQQNVEDHSYIETFLQENENVIRTGRFRRSPENACHFTKTPSADSHMLCVKALTKAMHIHQRKRNALKETNSDIQARHKLQ